MGGAQRRTVDLINGFGRRFRHAVIALDGSVSAAESIDPHVEAETSCLAIEKTRLLSPRNLARFRALYRSVSPDLLLTYNFGSMEAVIANRLFAQIPHIHVEDGFGAEESGRRQLRRRVWLRRLALRGRSQLVVPSFTLKQLARDVWRLDERSIHHLPNGIDLNRFGPRQAFGPAPAARATEPVVGSVGVFRAEKNFARLIRAFSACLGQSSAQLVLVGDGPERAALEAMSRELAQEGRIVFPGFAARPERLLAGFDIFALSSDTEQMPIGLVEAMAAGLPIVATDVGDVRRLLPAEQQPYVVEKTDEAAFASALRELAERPELRRSLGARNAAHARAHFDLKTMLANYGALFDRLLSRSGSTACSADPASTERKRSICPRVVASQEKRSA
jgi:L-malate glycosyltransferase